MSKRFLLILAGLFVIFLGFIIYNERSSTDTTTVAGSGSNHTQGAGTAGVTVVEFADFQCPACAQYYPTFNAIKEKYGDKITFQFRHFPLVNIHTNAMAAHRAAEAAAKQNKFWEMHNLLYERQQQWSEASNAPVIFEDYATELGLNIEQYKSDVSSEAVSGIINSDVKAAQALGATSTPTIVINGQKLEELPANNTLEAWSELIDQAIAEQSQ